MRSSTIRFSAQCSNCIVLTALCISAFTSVIGPESLRAASSSHFLSNAISLCQTSSIVLKGPLITPHLGFDFFVSCSLDASTSSFSFLKCWSELRVFITRRYRVHEYTSSVPVLVSGVPSTFACQISFGSCTGSISRPPEFSIHRRRFSRYKSYHSAIVRWAGIFSRSAASRAHCCSSSSLVSTVPLHKK